MDLIDYSPSLVVLATTTTTTTISALLSISHQKPKEHPWEPLCLAVALTSDQEMKHFHPSPCYYCSYLLITVIFIIIISITN